MKVLDWKIAGCVILLLVLVLALGFRSFDEGARADAQPAPAAAGAEPPAVAEARRGGISRCLGVIDHQVRGITTAYASFSSFAKQDGDEHLFESFTSMATDDAAAPRSVGVLMAAPTRNGCDGAVTQVFPVMKSCADVQAVRAQAGQSLGDFNGVLMTPAAATTRQLLVSAGPKVCVIVTVATAFGSVP